MIGGCYYRWTQILSEFEMSVFGGSRYNFGDELTLWGSQSF